MQEIPYSLMAELDKVAGLAHPPVHLWNPPNEKAIDLIVKRDGTWHYGGTPIRRPRLVRLFASVLKREGDDYFLVTPVEKCRITVEDTPFQAVLMESTGQGAERCLSMTTDMAETIPVDAEHPLRISQQGDEWIPYVLVRGGMEARVNRNVYYQLAEMLEPHSHPDTGESWLGVWSHGEFFPMMPA